MPVPAHDEFPTTRNSTNKWGPYSGAGDFSTSMVIVLAILLCTLLFALIIVAFFRIILSNRRNRLIISDDVHHNTTTNNNNNNNKEVIISDIVVQDDAIPTLRFSAGTKLAGVGAECAICLNEFAEGDGVRVLPACNHGFHVKCIEGWFVSHSSCPTCRRSCRAAPVDLTAENGLMEMV
ncbi:RING-H2 finger protein ATL79-like [Dioscorea cayenensis subsp. rotundata]|uniref:RING-H2 finger protein ATL79-like n=1 Tax=Dioscorea cayennensis subsp. rotundata TaxID=55577 RepID=A0AB40C5Y9_DIOCR|nr:RING-H2 finger protein ATL79-like [Dioscorea cayenensis subsp. rotundata]